MDGQRNTVRSASPTTPRATASPRWRVFTGVGMNHPPHAYLPAYVGMKACHPTTADPPFSKVGSRFGIGNRSPASRDAPHPSSLRDCGDICSSLVRAIGLSLLLLGIAWIIVEFALNQLVLHQGPLGDGQTEGINLYRVARVLPYGMVAFLVAYATVSLLSATSDARLTLPSKTRLRRLPGSDASPSSGIAFCVKLVPPSEAYPRAPPT